MAFIRIRTLREKADKSQEQLATAVGVNQTAVSQWERGVALPGSDKLPAIAEFLGCSIDALFREEKAGA